MIRIAVACLLVLVAGCAEVQDSCSTMCDLMCDRLSECEQTALGTPRSSCLSRCRISVATSPDHCAVRHGELKAASCDELPALTDCPAYCVTLCIYTRDTCERTLDVDACTTGCLRYPALCNLNSFAKRVDCSQLTTEARCYVGNADAQATKSCSLGTSGGLDQPCNSVAVCKDAYACRVKTATCGPCQSDADCAVSASEQRAFFCNTQKRCQEQPRLCTEDTDCERDEVCSSSYGEGTCRKRCSEDSDCPAYTECSSGCSEPVGNTCDPDESESCGGYGNCINLDASNLRIDAAYCTISCYSGDDVPACPSGYSCVESECRKRASSR